MEPGWGRDDGPFLLVPRTQARLECSEPDPILLCMGLFSRFCVCAPLLQPMTLPPQPILQGCPATPSPALGFSCGCINSPQTCRAGLSRVRSRAPGGICNVSN